MKPEREGSLTPVAKRKGFTSPIIAFMLAHAANDGFDALFPPLLPLIRDYFDLSYAKLGGVMTSYSFLASLLQIPVGYLAYFFHSPTIMVTGLLWVSTGLLMATFAKTYWMLAGAFSLAGMGSATYHPLSFSLLSKLYGKEVLGRIVGYHMGASSAAHVVTPILVILFANRFGWYWPIRLWCFLGIGAAFFLGMVLRSKMMTAQRNKGKVIRPPYISSPLVLFVLFIWVWCFAWKGITTFLPTFLVETAHFSIKFATLYFTAMYVIEVFSRPLIGAYSDKIGKRKMVLVAECILCALLFLSLTLFKTKFILLFIMVGIGFIAGSIPVLYQTHAIEMIPDEQRERTLGFLFTINAIATTISPLFVGFIADLFGLMKSFLILTVIIGIGLIFLIFSKES